ncbi:MAG: hypothetical protein V3G42_03740 [Oscillospiraceae bacterium]
MLTKLLSRATCAECRLCCVFDAYAIWETPVIIPELRKKIETILPHAEFISKGEESYIFRIRELDENELFNCPLLDPAKGCRLGTEKPFDCQIYPFQVTEIGNRQAIMLSTLCKAVAENPVNVLLDFLKEGIAETIFSYAEKYPDVIRPYDYRSPILLWKPETPKFF